MVSRLTSEQVAGKKVETVIIPMLRYSTNTNKLFVLTWIAVKMIYRGKFLERLQLPLCVAWVSRNVLLSWSITACGVRRQLCEEVYVEVQSSSVVYFVLYVRIRR